MSLEARLRAALERPAPQLWEHDDLDAHEWGETTEAAVLVPVTDRPSPGLILTVRHAGMRKHAGQVAFPGGRIDPGEDAQMAALREAQEELGIDPAHVQPLGELDRYRTGTGFCVTPILSILPPDLPLVPQPTEVDDWFEAPLDRLLDPAHHLLEEADWKGRRRRYWRIDYEERYIWGATAAMIVNLSKRLGA